MKKYYKFLVSFALSGLLLANAKNLYAGNEDRAGQAGATELLVNPWARSSGWAGANSSSVRGLEAMFLNVAGTAFTRKTEILFARTNWLMGTGVNINSFGFTQRVGETGALGLGLVAMDFGDIDITTVEQPEGEIGKFSAQFLNIGLSYAKGFSDNIFGGINFKLISESISDVGAKGIAIDAGIQYVTGATDNVKFGIALKNVGPRLKFNGDGLSYKVDPPNGTNGSFTMDQRTDQLELPSLLSIGGAYDFYFSKDSSAVKTHRLTVAANFTSNSFTKDEFKIGLEYGLKSFLMVRAGYSYEQGIFNGEQRTTALTGPCGGFTVEIPFGQNKSTFGLDYSYRATNPFQGTHSIGARINL